MANEYDRIVRENFKELKAGLLRQIIPDAVIRVQPLVPKLQHTLLERETDTVAEVNTEAGDRFVLHIEWQSSNDRKMASRMALYDLLLNQTYQLDVLGIVIYLGNDPLRMEAVHCFFDFHYGCRIIDARQLDPEIFLASDDAGEIIFAVVTGSDDPGHKQYIIRRIFAKLQLLFADDPVLLRIKIRQLEWLSLLRGKALQQKIVEEERNMPVIINIKEDLRYQQGLHEGMEQGLEQGEGLGAEKALVEAARKMLQNGLDLHMIRNITGLSINRLQQLAADHSAPE